MSARVPIWARPGSARDALEWDAWRGRWVVRCRAPAVGGAANESIARLIAGWIGVPPEAVRWVHAGRSHAKSIEVDGLSASEVEERLRRASSLPSGDAR